MKDELAVAIARLDAAANALDAAIARHLDVDGRRSELEMELQVMGEDRLRLAGELDSTAARLARVEAATVHVGRRVENAVATLQDVLSRAPLPPPGGTA